MALWNSPAANALPGSEAPLEGPQGGDSAREFEAAVHATDAAVRSSQKRLREHEFETYHTYKKPLGEAFPFQDPDDVLNAALRGVAEVTRTPAPGFDCRSAPERVQLWVTSTLETYGRACRAQGQDQGLRQETLRLPPATAKQAMDLMARLNNLLSS